MEVAHRPGLGRHVSLLAWIQDRAAIRHPVQRALPLVVIAQPGEEKSLLRTTGRFAGRPVNVVVRRARGDAANRSLVELVLLREAERSANAVSINGIGNRGEKDRLWPSTGYLIKYIYANRVYNFRSVTPENYYRIYLYFIRYLINLRPVSLYIRASLVVANLNVESIVDRRCIMDLLGENAARDARDLLSCIPASTKHLYVCRTTSSQYRLLRDSNDCRGSGCASAGRVYNTRAISVIFSFFFTQARNANLI